MFKSPAEGRQAGFAPVRLLRIIALFVLAQGVFWGVFISAEHASAPDVRSPAMLRLALAETEAGLADAPEIEVRRDAVPTYRYRDPDRLAYAVFRHDFDWVAQDDEDAAILLRWSRRIVQVSVNGEVLREQTPVDLWGVLGGFEPAAYIIPEGVLQPQGNRLEIQVDGRSLKIAPELFIAPSTDVLRAIGWGRAMAVDLPIGAIAAMGVLIVICVTALWPPQDRRRMNGLILLLVFWIVRNLTFLGVDAGVPDSHRMLVHFLTTYAFLGAIAYFGLAWTEAPRRLATGVVAGVGGLLAVTLALHEFVLEPLAFFRTAFWTETVLTIIVCAACIGLLLFDEYRRSRDAVLQAGLFIVALTAVMVDAIDDQFDLVIPVGDGLPITFYYAPMCGLFLGFGLCAMLATQATAARNAVVRINATLREKLAEQEREIASSLERQHRLERARVKAEERQRIMRDMHDGVGSLLLGMLVQIKAGRLDMDAVADGVRKGLDDLRLMITAMDTGSDNLVEALAMFRRRAEPQIQAAGLAVTWTIDLEDTAVFGPRETLQVYRILQEAIANTIRHSGASELQVSVGQDFKHADAVVIEVCDNGSGFDTDASAAGSGLRNMRRRAAMVSAKLELESKPGRSCVRLVLEGAATQHDTKA
ncbi:MAG: histidine kinase [Alphaproteobacteria bacterium]|nr:histidine kinase [Alphaproteobacteria bacterium]